MYQIPWNLNADFSKDRLMAVASLIADVRDEVIELHDQTLGDTRLSLGMRTYECCRTRLIKASENGSFPWMSILTREGRFTFTIGETPVRFTRNDPKCLPARKLIVSENAMEQMTLFGDKPYAQLRWFFVFDTDCKTAAEAVYFIGYNKLGRIICQWEIEVDAKVTLLSDASASTPQAVELDKPSVAIKAPTPAVEEMDHGI